MCERRNRGRQRDGIVRVCRLRSARLLLLGVQNMWRNHVAKHAQNQQIHTLTLAVESYEQALREVTAKRDALQINNVELEGKMQQSDTARQWLLKDFESKFTELKEAHFRTAEAVEMWKSKLQEEQYTSHVARTEAKRDLDEMQRQVEAAGASIGYLSEEVAAKNTIIATLEQRVKDHVTEICALGDMCISLHDQSDSFLLPLYIQSGC